MLRRVFRLLLSRLRGTGRHYQVIDKSRAWTCPCCGQLVMPGSEDDES